MSALHESDLAYLELDEDGDPQFIWPRIETTTPREDLL